MSTYESSHCGAVVFVHDRTVVVQSGVVCTIQHKHLAEGNGVGFWSKMKNNTKTRMCAYI